MNKFGRKTPTNPVEIVRLVVNCELSVCVGDNVVVGANVKRLGRNIPENPVDIVLPVVMSVGRMSSLPDVVPVVIWAVVSVVVVVVVVDEVMVVVVVVFLVVVVVIVVVVVVVVVEAANI